MGCFAGSGGHNKIVPGANSQYGIEHVEDRRFLDAVAIYVQAAGWKYVNCSDEVGTTQYDVWNNAAHNHLHVTNSNVDLQFHLNASPGGTGCEVWLHPSYGDRELAAKISGAMAGAFGLRDRGIKFSTELGWINKTKTGLLPEICFIDNEVDMQKYRANFDKAAKAVAEVIVGQSIQSNTSLLTGGNTMKWTMKSGGLGANLAQEIMDKLAEFKVKGSLLYEGDGIFYLQCEPVEDRNKLGAITWYFKDYKGWYCEVYQV